jgi:branched-subunit amino acid transport protein
MTAVWATIAALALATAAIRAAGPLLLGGRVLPPRVMAVIGLLAPALLAALVVVQTLGADDGIAVDARVVGVATAGLAIAARRSVLVAVIAATVATAAVRALG